MHRIFRCLSVVMLCGCSLPAAEIALSGVDPTVLLNTNPPVFTFTVDSGGFFTSQYMNVSGATFLNLLITGPADGITLVGCSPDSVFISCSASIDNLKDLVTFTFSGGPGLGNNQSFLLTATNFVPGETLLGTSTVTVASPEPKTIFLILGVLAVVLVARSIRLRFARSSAYRAVSV